jgi:hypothetical protein
MNDQYEQILFDETEDYIAEYLRCLAEVRRAA